MIAFGPVPSRRLGKSLGINNIPAKICSYSCVYCQLGKTTKTRINRQTFYSPKRIFEEVENKVDEAKARHEEIDYLTFVPDGEPTLDINLGKEINLLRQIGIPIAALTNASIIWDSEVKDCLSKLDFVSLKVDAVSENLWRRINRPHRSLRVDEILDGIVDFSREFRGIIVTETMLIDDVDYAEEFDGIADFLAKIRLNKAYIAVPTRPPAESWIKLAKEELINKAFQTFSEKLGQEKVEYLIGYEGNAFAFTGNVKEDLISITSVHPMRKEAVEEFLKKAEADWSVVEEMLTEGKLIELEYEKHRYYMRKIPSRMNLEFEGMDSRILH
ncbi:radical SAM protein [Candidatus Bathyarchaeota archaeon]|nr:radical SAM protein [Candidatus Bathyarchaeota archaeon]